MPLDEQRISEIRRLAESFSGLQYVPEKSSLQWPWSSILATNQVVDLVRAVPWLLDALAESREAEERLRRALVQIRSDSGPTCPEYDPRAFYGQASASCRHMACEASRKAWEVASAALAAAPPDAEKPADA